MFKPAEVGSSSDAGSRRMAVELHVEGAETGVLADVRLSATVMDLRQQLSLLVGWPVLPLFARGNYHFEFNGKVMNEAQPLWTQGFRPGNIIHVVPTSRGTGGRARK